MPPLNVARPQAKAYTPCSRMPRCAASNGFWTGGAHSDAPARHAQEDEQAAVDDCGAKHEQQPSRRDARRRADREGTR